MRFAYGAVGALGLMAATLMAAPAQAWPALYVFTGYMERPAEECRQIMLEACLQHLQSCQAKDYGTTLAVDAAEDDVRMSFQCKFYDALGVSVYGVAGGRDPDGSRDILAVINQISAFVGQRKTEPLTPPDSGWFPD